MHNLYKIELNLLEHHISDDYERRVSSSCRPANTFGIVNHLSQAKMSCSSNEKCIGILESSCDNKGPFLFCKKGFETSDAHNSSCFYEKKNYSGMYLP